MKDFLTIIFNAIFELRKIDVDIGGMLMNPQKNTIDIYYKGKSYRITIEEK